jgi:hypothetical protein
MWQKEKILAKDDLKIQILTDSGGSRKCFIRFSLKYLTLIRVNKKVKYITSQIMVPMVK